MNEYSVHTRGRLIWDEVWGWEWQMPGFQLLHLNILAPTFHFNLSYLHHSVKQRSENCSCWRYDERERVWGSGETRVGAFNGVLELAHTGSWELIVNISQLCIQRHYIDSLKSVMVGEFIPQKLANTTNQGSLPSRIQLLNISQHTTACDLKIQLTASYTPNIQCWDQDRITVIDTPVQNGRWGSGRHESLISSHWSMKILISSQAHISVYPKSRIPLAKTWFCSLVGFSSPLKESPPLFSLASRATLSDLGFTLWDVFPFK